MNYSGKLRLTAKSLKALNNRTNGYIKFEAYINDILGKFSRNPEEMTALIAVLYNRKLNGSTRFNYNFTKAEIFWGEDKNSRENWLGEIKAIKPETVKKWETAISEFFANRKFTENNVVKEISPRHFSPNNNLLVVGIDTSKGSNLVGISDGVKVRWVPKTQLKLIIK